MIRSSSSNNNTASSTRQGKARRRPLINFVGGGKVMKELQRTAAFQAYNDILLSGNSAFQRQQYDAAAEKYFGIPGNPDKLGYVHQLLRGAGPFEPMFYPQDETDLARGETYRRR